MTDTTEKQKLKAAIQHLANTHLWDKNQFVYCTVDATNEAEQTCDCTPIGGDANTQILAVKLMAERNDGLLLIPADGSTVVVTYSKRNEPYVTLFSDLKKVIITTSEATQFNDGSFGGLVKVSELTAKINALENVVNSLITVFNAHVHPGVTVGAGVTSITATPQSGNINPITQQSDIENTLITHGK